MNGWCGLLLVLAASTALASEPSAWAKVFAYDATAPLEPKLTLLHERGGVKVYDLRALADRASWLERELGLKPTRPLLQKRLESDSR